MTSEEEAKWMRRLERERAARAEAERLLEIKSQELFEKNQQLIRTLEDVEQQVRERSREVEKLSLVASRATCGVVITDQNGRVEWVNEGFTRITGYSFHEVLGKVPGHILQGPGSDPETVKRMQACIKAMKPFTEEILNYTKAHKPYWIRLDAYPIENDGVMNSFVAIQTDITAQKLAEERMALLTQALEQSSDGFALTDPNGVFTYLNESHVRIFGYHRAGELLNQSWEVLYEKSEVARLKREVFPGLIKTGTWSGPALAKRKDGSLFHEALALKLLRDGRIICACRDDTDRVNREEQIRQARDNAESLNSELQETIRELDAFAHTVAHDLKNPLQGIIGLSETLLEYWDETDDERRKEFLQLILDSGKSQATIIQELLLMASIRKDEVRKQPVNLRNCVDRVQGRLAFMIDQRKAVVETTHLHSVMGYAPWLDEVLANYVSNAIKYGGQPPRIWISTELMPEGRIRLNVVDNGKGIREDTAHTLFTEWRRGDRQQEEGHGLGLSIVKRIARRLGGEVGAENSEHGGACFYCILPGADA